MSPFQGPRWQEMTAVFGGRFDPPHVGHIEAVHGLFQEPGVKEVRILVSPSPPHKPAQAPIENRLAMTRLAFESNQARWHGKITLDLRECERALDRPGSPTYSFDTLAAMQPEHGGLLAFVIGSDQLDQMWDWHRFPEILKLCHWIVLERKLDGAGGAGRKTLSQWTSQGIANSVSDRIWQLGPQSFLKLAPTSAPACSSTQIRETIARFGQASPGTLSEGVSAYLKKNGLYGSTPSSTIEGSLS